MAKRKTTSLTLKLIQDHDYKILPWKNGLGETKEITTDGKSPFEWRVSLASLKGITPFSIYSGYDRHLVVISGDSIVWKVGVASRSVGVLAPITFAGETEVTVTVKTPCVDFNVFTMREKYRASLFVARVGVLDETQFPFQGTVHFVYVIEGRLECLDPNTGYHEIVKAGDTLQATRLEGKECLNLRVQGKDSDVVCLWVTITRL